MLSTGGKLPQVSKTYNLIFHYGKHDSAAIDQLAHTIDLLWNLIRQHKDADQVRRDVARQAEELSAKYQRERDSQKKATLTVELSKKAEELEAAQDAVAAVEDNIFAVCPWLKTLGASPVPNENCSLDTLANIQLSETKVEKHVL
jgi:seryl-tRNA synthetase